MERDTFQTRQRVLTHTAEKFFCSVEATPRWFTRDFPGGEFGASQGSAFDFVGRILETQLDTAMA